METKKRISDNKVKNIRKRFELKKENEAIKDKFDICILVSFLSRIKKIITNKQEQAILKEKLF